MTRLATAVAALLIAAPALAQVDATADVDGDGFLSLPEALAAYPGMDPTDYDRLDTDNNRLLDDAEVGTGEAAALFSGLERAENAGDPFDATDFDADADGALTFEEVSNRIPGVPEPYFQDFDLDNSGTLDSQELNSGAFQNLLNKYGS